MVEEPKRKSADSILRLNGWRATGIFTVSGCCTRSRRKVMVCEQGGLPIIYLNTCLRTRFYLPCTWRKLRLLAGPSPLRMIDTSCIYAECFDPLYGLELRGSTASSFQVHA